MGPIIWREAPGLVEKISAAGYSIVHFSDHTAADDPAAVQAIIDAYTLDEAKAVKCAAVSAYAKSLRDHVIADVSAGEMASWPIKLAEASKFDAGADEATCPMLSMEASARGITVAQLVAKVTGNSVRFSADEASISGNDGRHRDAIAALTSFDEVSGYDFSAGWPEV